jgi:hypothetical protein
MIMQKAPNGRWIVKKKFSFAAVTGIIGALFALKGVHLATTPEQVVVVLSAFGTFGGWLLGLVFAADVVDKKLNDGKYNSE